MACFREVFRLDLTDFVQEACSAGVSILMFTPAEKNILIMKMTAENKNKSVRYYFRNRASGFSIHRAICPVVDEIAKKRHIECLDLPLPGTNPRTVLRNMWHTIWSRKSDCINHITGEVHYLTYLLPPRQTIVTVHDLGGLWTYQGIDLKYYRWRCVDSLLRARHVVAISEKTRQVILQNSSLPPEKVSVIYDPLPPGFSYSPKEFNSGKPVVLQVGAARWKNPARIAEALKGLDVHFRLVGMPDEDCIALMEHNGNEYSIVTDLDDSALIEEYKKADIVAFASSSEGFGMPLIEAQAVGRPVVASNIEPQMEVGGPGGAVYVDPSNIDALRKAFLNLIGSAGMREDIVGRGLENVARFAPQRIAAQYAEIYDSMD